MTIRSFLTGVGMISAALVFTIVGVNFFSTDASVIFCQHHGDLAVAKAEIVQGNAVAIEQYDTDGNVSYRAESVTAFTCGAIFGKGWTDALEDYD